MAKRAGAKDIAPRIRAAFMRAIDRLGKETGKTDVLEEIWIGLLRSDSLEALELLAKFIPKELLVESDPEQPFILAGKALSPEEWRAKYSPAADDGKDAPSIN